MPTVKTILMKSLLEVSLTEAINRFVLNFDIIFKYRERMVRLV